MSSPPKRVPPPTRLPGLITTPLSWLYSVGINHQNRRYDAGRGVTVLDRPVISIGNLSTGGTGKTPMVHLIVRMLEGMGHRPVIAMRGYGAKPGEKGDEQLEHERALPGVPIIAQPDRKAGLRSFFATQEGSAIDTVVLDDGFQHRKIARDLDIVLIDATRPPDQDALLPRGHLREPIDSLERAGLVVLTHSEQIDQTALQRLRDIVSSHTDAPVMVAQHAWSSLTQHTRLAGGWGSEAVSLDSLASKRVHAVCAIGNPHAFLAMARARRLDVVAHDELADHATMSESHALAWSRVQKESNSHWLMMTRKDWVKAEQLKSWDEGVQVIVPELCVEIDDEQRLSAIIRLVYSVA